VPLHAQHLTDAIGQLPLLEHLELRQHLLWKPRGAQGAEHEHPRWDSWLQLSHLHTVQLEWIPSWPPPAYELLAADYWSCHLVSISDAQIDVLRGLPALIRLRVATGRHTDMAVIRHLCRLPHTLQLRDLDLSELTLSDADLRVLAAVPTLTTLQPTGLLGADLQAGAQQLQCFQALHLLRWSIRGDCDLPGALQAFGALSLRGLTALRFHDNRLSEEELARVLALLHCLKALQLCNSVARSASFLLSGSLPVTLRALRLWSRVSLASLEDALPALSSLTELVLSPWCGTKAALEPLAQRLRVPSALLPRLRSFSDELGDWDGPPQESPCRWD